MKRAPFIHARSLEPVNIQSIQMDDRTYETYLRFYREFNAQGVNLNQLTRAVNRDRVDGFVRTGYLRSLHEIREVNDRIATEIRKIKP